MTTALPWKTALIAGAGSQIESELARQLGQAGVKVFLTQAQQPHGLVASGVTSLRHDVTDAPAVARSVQDIESRQGAIDLAIFAGGMEPPMSASNYNAPIAIDVMDRNYISALCGLGAVVPGMIARKKGHIALISSVAGYRGLPSKAAHSPSHAALISLAESLKNELGGYGIKVSIVNPGFPDVSAPILDDEAARRIISGLARRRYEIAFPWKSVLAMKLYRIMPNTLVFWLERRGS